MDSKAKLELEQIRAELASIINEMQDISRGVRTSFSGIGNDKCAACITGVVEQYVTVKRKLDNIDTTTVTEEFAKAHGGGGSF